MAEKRSLQELLTTDEPAWPQVQNWARAATNTAEVLPPDEDQRHQALVDMQVTTRSPMGAIAHHTGGLLIDKGGLRFLGSGHPNLPRSLPGWNQGRSTTPDGKSKGFLLIADDVVGGFYALNGGAFGPGTGQAFYFAPDTLCWEPMNDMGYSEFLVWSFGPHLARFYESMHWEGWEPEVSSLRGNQSFSFYPFLWTKEGKDITKCYRKPCSIAEVFSLNLIEFPKQLRASLE